MMQSFSENSVGGATSVRTISISRSTFFWCFWSALGALLCGYVWNVKPQMSPNDNARWDTVWSLVEHGTYEIFPEGDERAVASGQPLQLGTIDKVVRDGKTYSSKPPLLPTVIAGWVWLQKQVIKEPFSKDRIEKGERILGSINIYGRSTLLLFNVGSILLFLWLYRRFLDRYAATDFAWCYCLVAGGVGTLLTGYVGTLNNHLIAACSAFAAVYLLLRIWHGGQRQIWRFAAVGLLAGWTAANELPAGLLVVATLLIVFAIDWKKSLVAYVPALALVAAAFFYTNWLGLGKPPVESATDLKQALMPAYLQRNLYDYPGSYWKDSEKESKPPNNSSETSSSDGDAKTSADKPSTPAPKKSPIDSLNDNPEPKWLYFLHMTVGHHGLFSLSPIWMLALLGLVRSLVGLQPFLRGFDWILTLISIFVFCFYWLITTEHNYGGFCHGARWLMWLSTLWLLFLTPATDWLASAGARWFAWILLLVSTFSMADTLYNPWTYSWLHRVLKWFGAVPY